jgi:anti-anti-sigma factor
VPDCSQLLGSSALGLSLIEHDRSLRIELSGELDIATSDRVERACLSGSAFVFVDMARLTFMDCGGYGALLAARRALESRGGSLVFSNLRGQPSRVVQLFSQIDRDREPELALGHAA